MQRLCSALLLTAAAGCTALDPQPSLDGLFVGYTLEGLCLGLNFADDRLTGGFLAGHPAGVWPLQDVRHLGQDRYVVDSAWGVMGKRLDETWNLTFDRTRAEAFLEVNIAGRRGDHRHSFTAFRMPLENGARAEPSQAPPRMNKPF